MRTRHQFWPPNNDQSGAHLRKETERREEQRRGAGHGAIAETTPIDTWWLLARPIAEIVIGRGEGCDMSVWRLTLVGTEAGTLDEHIALLHCRALFTYLFTRHTCNNTDQFLIYYYPI